MCMSELLFAGSDSNPIYHLENPLRQSWADVLDCLAEELQIADKVPMQVWIEKVAQAPEEDNPAKQLLQFFEHEFEHNASGEVVMDTAHSRAASSSLAKIKPVELDTIQLYLRAWKEAGFL